MKKYLLFNIILIIILILSSPIIISIKSTKQDIIKTNNVNIVNIYETSNIGLDLAIIDIIPYVWYPNGSQFGQLRISLELKNIGNASFYGWIKYYGNASFFINNKFYSYAWGGRWGYFNPDNKWIPKSGHGLLFVNYLPRIFHIEFEITPTDSNPENNKFEQVYLVWANRLFPFWRHMPILELLPNV
ncbi:hypothetical protein AYK20_01345 [Thermoplasmatales archaeon SG8-52-1]|nr:MAG: hypothetical protein AYK20_01345 [Thermoplasmatales archaeon SG8-52-1]